MSIPRSKLLVLISSNEIARASVILLFSQTFTNILNYLYNIIIGRILSVDSASSAYGEFWALSSFGYFFYVPITALTLITTKQSAEWLANNKLKQIAQYVRYMNIKLFRYTALLSVVIILLSPLLKAFLHLDNNAPVIIQMLSISTMLLSVVGLGVLTGTRRFLLVGLVYIVPVLSKLIIGSILTLFYGVNGALAGNLTQSLISALLILIIIYRTPELNTTKLTSKLSFNFPWKLFIGSALATLSLSSFLSLDVVMVKHFLSNSYYSGTQLDTPSIYSMLSLFGRIIYFLGIGLSGLIIPFAKYSKNDTKRLSITSLSILFAVMIISPIITIYFLIPGNLISIVFGSEYNNASSLLGPYALATSLFALSSIMINHFISRNNYKFAFIPLFYSLLHLILMVIFHSSINDFIITLFTVNLLCFVTMLWYNYRNNYSPNG